MFRSTAVALVTLAVVSLNLSAVPAYGDEKGQGKSTTPGTGVESQGSAAPLAADVDWSLPPIQIGSAKRPTILPGLYVSLAVLQIFDAYSTTKGLSRGAQEANPVVQDIVGKPALFWTLKAATTVGPMIMAERLWRTNRVASIVIMVVANGAVAAVAANNAHVLHQQR